MDDNASQTSLMEDGDQTQEEVDGQLAAEIQDDDEGEPEYAIAAIIEWRSRFVPDSPKIRIPGDVELLVRWEGYDNKECTWEPEGDMFTDAPDVVLNYWATFDGGRDQEVGINQDEQDANYCPYLMHRVLRRVPVKRGGGKRKEKFEVQWQGYKDTTLELWQAIPKHLKVEFIEAEDRQAQAALAGDDEDKEQTEE